MTPPLLPGIGGIFAGMMAAAAQPPVTAFTFVASATSAAETIVVPAGAQRNDLALLCDRLDIADGGPIVIPAGFQQLFSAPGSGWAARNTVSVGKLEVGEGQVLTGVPPSTGRISKILYIYRPNGSWNGDAYYLGHSTVNSNGDPANQTKTPDGAMGLLIAWSLAGGSGTVTGMTCTPSSLNQIGFQGLRVGPVLYGVGETVASQVAGSSDYGNSNVALAAMFQPKPIWTRDKAFILANAIPTACTLSDGGTHVVITCSGAGNLRIPGFGSRNGQSTRFYAGMRQPTGTGAVTPDFGDTSFGDVAPQMDASVFRLITSAAAITPANNNDWLDIAFAAAGTLHLEGVCVF